MDSNNNPPRKRKKRSIICPGCGTCFESIPTYKDLIEIHMRHSTSCAHKIVTCKNCKEQFVDNDSLKKHVNRSINSKCAQIYFNDRKKSSYRTTEVLLNANDDEVESKYDVIETEKYKFSSLELIHNQTTLNVTKCAPIKKIKESLKDQVFQKSDDSDEDELFVNHDPNYSTLLENNLSLNTKSNSHNDDPETTSTTNSTVSNVGTKSNPSNIHPVEFHNENHFMEILKIKNDECKNTIEDQEYLSSLHLIELMISKKISLSHYNDFMSWKYNDRLRNTKPLSLEKVIKIATQKNYGETLSKKMQPIVKPMSLTSGRNCYMVQFDCASMIFDMLNNNHLTKLDNMIFSKENNNPFHIEHKDDFGDIESSLLYENTFKDLQIDTDLEILCPLALYLDELKLDAFGKMGLEPIVLTLLMYNRKTRNCHEAHRVIGYMPNFTMLFAKASYTADDKANDYHQCLSVILDDLKKLQRRKGFKWEFKFEEFPNKTFKRNLIFPLFYVIGDAKGNDMLAGRYGSRSNTTCIARDCDVKLQNCSNPKHRCTFYKQSDMCTKSQEELKNLSFRKLNRNAFNGIWFGSQPYGLFAALPPEPLHVFNMGIIERLAFSFTSRLTPELLKVVDIHVGYNCNYNCKQSDRSLPVMETFSNGVSDSKKLTAREKLARIFCIYVTLLTTDLYKEIVGKNGRHVNENMNGTIDRTEYNNWILVFEETLLLSSWIYRESHPKIFFKGGRISVAAKRIVKFMKMYRNNAPRNEGMGLNILKFHHLLHLWWVIRLFASLLNVDGARGESNNIFLAKNIGNTTQKHHATLNYQTAMNSYKRNLILKEIQSKVSTKFNKPEIDCNSQTKKGNCPHGSKFTIFFDYNSNTCRSKWTGYKKIDRYCLFSQIVLQAIFTKLQGYNGGTRGKRIITISGFTEYSINNEEKTSVRACPNFRGAHHWYDWVNVTWKQVDDSTQILPAQVLMMLDTSSITFEEFTLPQEQELIHKKIPSPNIAFVHSVSEKRSTKTMPCPGGNGFSSKIARWFTMETCYQMISTNTFHSPCFIIVDTCNSNAKKIEAGTAVNVIALTSKKNWSNNFIDYSKRNIVPPPDRKVQDNELKFFEN